MKQSILELMQEQEVFAGSDTVLRFTFKAIYTRGQSAHFWKYNDCFECLSPSMQEIAV